LLARLNDVSYDPEVIDRTLEFSEALACLKRVQPDIITSAGCTDLDYMCQGYEEYLEEQKAMNGFV
jgi:uncharacterized protein Smg (DUF494 family)